MSPLKGRSQSPEHKAKRLAALAAWRERYALEHGHRPKVGTPYSQGHQHAPEVLAKMAPTQFAKGQRPYNKGVPMRAESKAKLSAAKKGQPSFWKGKKRSAETRAKLKAIATTPEGRAQRSLQRSKQVLPLRDSSLELAIQKALADLGHGFRTQAILPGVPRHQWDIALTGQRVLIEADGCYWHGCEQCGHAQAKYANRVRDAALTAAAEAQGWTVLRIWEHDKALIPDILAVTLRGKSADPR